MASSPTPQTSNQAQRYRDDSFDEQRNDQVSDNVNARLLDTHDNHPGYMMAQPRSNIKALRVLTALALTASTLAAMLLIALRIFVTYQNWNAYELLWPTRAGSRAVGITAVFSILISLYNLTSLSRKIPKEAPLPINILFDILIGVLVLLYAKPGLSAIAGTKCFGYLPLDYEACHRHALPSRIMVGIALGLGVVYGIIHLLLFAMRLITASWSKGGNGITVPAWRIPTGKLKFETSLTFERQDAREMGGGEREV